MLLLFVFPRMRIQYVFKRNPYLNQESTVEVSEEGILNENPNMRSQRNWSMFIRWAENNHLFMVYSAPNQFLLLPKRTLAAGEADQLRDSAAAQAARQVARHVTAGDIINSKFPTAPAFQHIQAAAAKTFFSAPFA
jgi:hypothetical protein